MQGNIDLIVFFEGSLEKPLHFKHPLEDVVTSKYNLPPTVSFDNFSDSVTTSYLKEAFQNLEQILIIFLCQPNCALGHGLTLIKHIKKAKAKIQLEVIEEHRTVLKMTKILSSTDVRLHSSQSDFTKNFV